MRKHYLLFVCLFTTFISFGQQATNTASGSGQAGSIILDWSLGELTLVNTAQSGPLVLTQGLHQGKLIAFVRSNGIADGELVISPNPTTGILQVQAGFLEAGRLSLTIYDAQGKLLQRQEGLPNLGSRTLNLTLYASSMYLISASFQPDAGGKARTRTYKILRLS